MVRYGTGDGEVRETSRDQIFEKFYVAIRSRSMPGSVNYVRRNRNCHDQPRAALTLVCTCMDQGYLEIRLDRKIRITRVRKLRNSRDLAVQSIPLKWSRVRLISQLEKKLNEGNHETNSDSVQVAVSCSDPDVFLLAGHFG